MTSEMRALPVQAAFEDAEQIAKKVVQLVHGGTVETWWDSRRFDTFRNCAIAIVVRTVEAMGSLGYRVLRAPHTLVDSESRDPLEMLTHENEGLRASLENTTKRLKEANAAIDTMRAILRTLSEPK